MAEAATVVGSASQTLMAIALCGIMGLVGQGARAIVGLKNAGSAKGRAEGEAFDAAYLFVSLMIGMIAGILAGIATGLEKFADAVTLQNLLAIAAAGYAGADFIENATSLVIPRAPAAGPASAPPRAPDAPAPSRVPPPPPQSPPAVALPPAQARPPSLAPVAPPPAAAIGGADEALAAALRRVAPGLRVDVWAPALAAAFARYGLTTDRRQAAAVGQFLVEANPEFDELAEDLDYTHVDAVMRVFGVHFRDRDEAEAYLRNPRKLADRVYADRLGNGDEASGDGYRFRGRGLIQITGRSNYADFARTVGLSVDDASRYCATPEGAAMSGCWFLWSRHCLACADAWDIEGITERVNGRAMLGLSQREAYSEAMLREMRAHPALAA